MAVTIEELKVLINANSSGLTKELNSLNNKLDQVAGVATRTDKALGKTIFGGVLAGNVFGNLASNVLSKVSSAFTSVTSAVITNGSAFARIKVATETVAHNMGMTTAEIDKLRDSLAESNTYGIYAENVIRTLAQSGLVQLASSMSTVDARTGKMVTGVEALTLTMKDLSASAGIDSAEGIQRLTKFIRRGEASFADGIIEVGNLNTAYRVFAKTRGKEVQQLTATELAEARLAIVRAEGAKAFGAYANTMQTSGKAFDSFKNKMVQSATSLGSFFEPALSAGANALYQFAGGIYNAITGSEVTIRNFANRVAGYVVAIVRVIGKLLSAIPMIGQYFSGLANFSLKPIKAMGDLKDVVDQVGGGMGSASDKAKKLKKDLLGLAGFDEMQTIGNSDAGTGVGTVGGGGVGGGAGGGAGIAIPDFSKEVNKIADEVTKKWDGLYAKYIQPFVDGLGGISKWATDNKDLILGMVETLGIFFGLWKATELLAFIQMSGGLLTVLGSMATALWTATGAKIADKLETMALSAMYAKDFLVQSALMVKNLAQQAIQWGVNTGAQILNKGALVAGAIAQGAMNAITIIWNGIAVVASAVTWAFGAAVAFLTSPIGLVILAIVALIAVGVLIYKNWDKIKEVAGNLWASLKDTFSKIGSWIGGIWQGIMDKASGVWDNLKRGFNTIWDTAKSVWQKIGDFISGIFKNIVNGYVGMVNKMLGGMENLVNGAVNPLNALIRGANDKLHLGISEIRISMPKIPYLAQGGVISSPTMAMVGEAGKEAVMPLERNTEWIDELAKKINTSGGNAQTTIVLKIGEDTVFSKVVDWVNERTMLGNKAILKI